MPHDLSDQLQRDLFLLRSDEQLDGQSIKELVVGILEEEGVLTVDIAC